MSARGGGGARGSKGSWPRPELRWERIWSMVAGWVITATIWSSEPQRATEERLDFEQLAKEAGPGGAAGLREVRFAFVLGGGVGERGGGGGAGVDSAPGAAGVPAVVAGEVLAAVGDLIGDGVDPVEDVEGAGGGAGPRVGGGGNGDLVLGELLQGVEADGRAGEVAGDVFGALGLFGEEELLCVHREAGVNPGRGGRRGRLRRAGRRGGRASSTRRRKSSERASV